MNQKIRDSRKIKKNSIRVYSAFFLMFLFFIAGAVSLSALEQPTKDQLLRYANDGSLAQRIQSAISLGNHIVAPQLVRNFINQAQELGLNPPIQSTSAANLSKTSASNTPQLPKSRGSIKTFALLISFPDYPAFQTPQAIASKLFGDGDGNWPYESLRNYYRRSSYNTLDIEGDVLGWYTPPYSRAGMPQTPEAREKLIEEALSYYRNQGHDFSQYDNDGDGRVDYFMVIWTGPNNGWGSFWWEYQTSVAARNISLNGITLDQTRYSWLQASHPDQPAFDARAAIHETGNAFGLPDYYDYIDSNGSPSGLGGLDMMGGDCGDHNAFSKMLLGWITPQVFDLGRGEFSLKASGSSPEAVLIVPNSPAAGTLDDFYLVQNRFRVENDFYLPIEGLMTWHVDASISPDGSFLSNNSSSNGKLLSLLKLGSSFSDAAAGLTISQVGIPSLTQYFTVVLSSNLSSSISPLISGTGSSLSGSPRIQALGSGLTYYVDGTLGNDSNNGLSQATPWQTINKINNSAFSPGDSILFKCGGTWSGTTLTIPSGGSSGNQITLGAYGSGAKPIISAAINQPAITVMAANRGYWTIDGLDLRASGSVPGMGQSLAIYFNYWPDIMGVVPGWIIQNCAFNAPIHVSGPNITINNNVFNGTGNATAIMAAICIREGNGSGALIQGNTVSNFKDRGIWAYLSANNCIVRNNIVHDITAGNFNTGAGISFDGYGSIMSGEKAYGNIIYNCSGTGISHENCFNQATYGNLIHDCIYGGISAINYNDYRSQAANGSIHHNIIYNTNLGISIFYTNTWSFLNNVIYQGTGASTSAFKVMDNSTYVSALTFTNNIIAGAWNYPLNVPDNKSIWTQLDYNDIVPAGTLMMIQLVGGTKTLSDLWALGLMTHGIASDPLFVANGADFHLQGGSPCRSAGVNVGLTQDFAGNPIPAWAGKNPDIGAYENQSAPAITALTPSPAPPQATGTMITWTATTTGGIAPLQYQYWLYSGATGTWTMVRDYGISASWTWTPTQAAQYAVQVRVRNAGSTTTYDALKNSPTFSITVPSTLPIVTSLTPSPTVPRPAGTTITWTAAATGGTAPLQYQYWLYSSVTASWTMGRDYSTSPSWAWTSAQAGQYAVQVWVRNAGSTTKYDAWLGSGYFNITAASGPPTVTSLKATPAPPQSAGTTITWTATATGGTAPLQYQYWLYSGVTASWTMVRDYSTSASCSWTPTQAAQYAIQVWVRNAGSTAKYDAWLGSGYFTIR